MSHDYAAEVERGVALRSQLRSQLVTLADQAQASLPVLEVLGLDGGT